MGRNKDSYIKLLRKVCEKYYPDLTLDRIECVETNRFDHLSNSWISDGYTMFVSIKRNPIYNIFDIEQFIESVLGVEVVVSVF